MDGVNHKMAAILNFAFLKIPQWLETHISRDIITRMLEMHIQSRKKVYQPKQGYPPWLPD